MRNWENGQRDQLMRIKNAKQIHIYVIPDLQQEWH